MSRMILRRIFGYCLTIGGAVLTFNRLSLLGKGDLIVGWILAGVFFLIYVAPLLIFGASIRLQDEGLRVQQYVDVQIHYSEVRACHSFVLPPFRMVMVITRRRFPLSLLIEGQERGDTIVEDLRHRIGQAVPAQK